MVEEEDLKALEDFFYTEIRKTGQNFQLELINDPEAPYGNTNFETKVVKINLSGFEDLDGSLSDISHELAHVRLHRNVVIEREEEIEGVVALREVEAQLYTISKNQNRGYGEEVWKDLLSLSSAYGNGTLRDGIRLGNKVLGRLMNRGSITFKEKKRGRKFLKEYSKIYNLNEKVLQDI